MTNVMFKRGTHAALLQLIAEKKCIDGAFYLTTDTNRLFAGVAGGTAVELNKSVSIADSIATLPTTNVEDGQFYYVKLENVLAYFDKGQNKWVQINADTKLAASEEAIDVDALMEEGVAVGAKISMSVSDTAANTAKGEFNLKGADAVQVSNSGNEVVITAHDTKYAFDTEVEANASKGVITLLADGEEASKVNIVGSAGIVVSTATDGTITVTPDASMDVSGAYNTGASAAFDANGKLTIGVTDAGGTKEAEITPVIKLGDNATEYKFANGVANLPVYTKEETEHLIRTADALVFRGTVSSADAAEKLVLANAQNGDVYKATSAITSPVIAGSGDLIIASGVEDENGKLTGEASWIVIESGDDQAISGVVDAESNSIAIKDQDGVLAGISLTAGDNIVITSTGDKDLATTIAHGAPLEGTDSSVTEGAVGVQKTAESLEFTAVTGVTRDKNGHITDVETRKFTVVDTHNALTAVEFETAAGEKVADKDGIGGSANIKNTVTTSDGAKDDTVVISSDSLKVTAGTKAVSVDLVWGTF